MSTILISTMSVNRRTSYFGARLSRISHRAVPAVILASALAACGGPKAEADAADSTTVSGTLVLGAEDVATAREAEIGTAIQLSGALQPRDVAVLRAQVPGTITELRVDNGVRVQAGQRLLTIKAAGVVGQAAGAKAAVAAAEASLAVARKQLDAANALFSAGAMSAIEKQSAEAAFESAQAQVAAARAQSAGADEAASHTSVVAPFAGVVSSRRKQAGEPVSMGDELLTVVDGRVLELPGQVGVADAPKVRTGQPVSFTLDAFPGESFVGKVARIDPVADAGTRQVGVYVDLPNRNGRIVGGQFARGQIDLGVVRAVVVPATAVVRSADSTSAVFVISNGSLARRTVTVGPRDAAAGLVGITSGVSAGEQVLRTPTPEIREGTAVRVMQADGAAGALPSSSGAAADTASAKSNADTSARKE